MSGMLVSATPESWFLDARISNLGKASHFRMTKELYEVLQTEAASADMTLSDYVRKLLTSRKPIIKKRIEVVFNDPKILQIFRNLEACGNNLNQIAAYLNDGRTMTNQMWKDIKECISELYEIRLIKTVLPDPLSPG